MPDETPHDEPVERVIIDAAVTDTFTIQKNIAANGRLFSALVVAICLAAFIQGQGAIFAALAMLAAIPVGAAVILDQMPVNRTHKIASLAVYGLSAAVAAIFLLAIW